MVRHVRPGDRIDLSWQDNTSGNEQEDGFVIERRSYMGTDAWHEVGQVGPDVTTFSNIEYLHGYVTYIYRVGAVKN